MNSIFNSLLRALVVLLSLLLVDSAAIAAGEAAAVAESWPLDMTVPDAAHGTLGNSRSQKSAGTATALQLNKLEIPARANPSMVRIRGVLIPPQTGGYTFNIYGNDDAEFWLGDDETGEWKLVQSKWNPVTGVGRIKLQQGVAKRFEFWTKGGNEVSVQWELVQWQPAANAAAKPTKREIVSKQAIPATFMRGRIAKEGDRHGSGLRDGWKQQYGLDLNSDDGPDGPWGDPDGDGLLNWQEQMAGTNPLKADAEGASGLVRWEFWRNIPGKYVFDLTRSQNFPQKPDEVRYLSRLEIPPGNGSDYGSRVRGWITAPEGGEYTFMVIANDTAELWLGESDSPESRKLIARVEQSGARSKWTRRVEQVERPLLPEQIAAHISLEKGKKYYIEVLYKQGEKEDHCSVGWIVPGQTAPQVIGTESLTSWSPIQGANVGTESFKPELRGQLTVESWENLPGDSIKDLVLSSDYPVHPSLTAMVDNLDFSDEGDNWGCRLRGYLTAPEDGPYNFYVSGNDACILFLSDSADKFRKQEIAQTPSRTKWRSFGPSYSQRSENIELKKGQKYYIEIVFKRGAALQPVGGAIDHASVAWKRPGRHGLPETVIDSEYFSAYQPDKRDLDDNDLPDDWEKINGLVSDKPTAESGAWGDPDGDFLENFREYQLELNPKLGDVHGASGFALWECWDNVEGTFEELKTNPAFPFNPTQRKWAAKLEGPQGHGESYGSRLRAFLIPPTTGDYTFAISGDDECELWLSNSESHFDKERIVFVSTPTEARDWSTMSRSIHLQAGKRYFIEALHKQDDRDDHLSVAWKIPGVTEFQVIQGKALAGYYFNDPNDQDGDDLPDDWEKANGLTVGVRDADGDLDRDGLTNREEFRRGTRADKADTDGDGIGDFDEIHTYRTNPLLKDGPPPVKVADIPLASFQSVSGVWYNIPNGGVVSLSPRGATDFKFTVQKAGIYLVELQAAARTPNFLAPAELQAAASTSNAYIPSIPVVVRVDDVEVGGADVKAGGSTHRWLSPSLAAGEHTVAIDNRNVRSGVTLEITSISLYQHDGVDQNGNSIADWMENVLRNENHVDVIPGESAISPVCIEGVSRFQDDTSISAGSEVIKTQAGIGGHWFANVPLESAGETKITGLFEDGALREEHIIRWTATNLCTTDKALQIRVGDSLKFIAVPSGVEASVTTVAYSRDSEALGESASGEPFIVKFDKAGTFTITAKGAEGSAPDASVQVEVVEADFGSEFSIAAGSSRVWDLPKVPHSLVIEADAELTLEEMERQASKSRRFTVSYPDRQSGSPRVLARLWKDGPIVAATSINAFWFAPASVTGNANVVETLADGTRVVEVRFVVSGRIPSDFSVWIQFIVTDAVFADGSTWHEIKASDFDADGVARLRMFKAPGTGVPFICHWIRPFYKDHLAD